MIPTDNVWLLSEGWICFLILYRLSMQFILWITPTFFCILISEMYFCNKFNKNTSTLRKTRSTWWFLKISWKDLWLWLYLCSHSCFVYCSVSNRRAGLCQSQLHIIPWQIFIWDSFFNFVKFSILDPGKIECNQAVAKLNKALNE